MFIRLLFKHSSNDLSQSSVSVFNAPYIIYCGTETYKEQKLIIYYVHMVPLKLMCVKNIQTCNHACLVSVEQHLMHASPSTGSACYQWTR